MTVHLPRPVYWLARKLVPIACVDILPYRNTGPSGPEVCLIERKGADGRTPGWALVGGRVMLRESLEQAMTRHLESTLGAAITIGPVDSAHPLHAAEYSPDGRPAGRIDPNKHAIALSYVIEIGGETEPRGEADDLRWFAADSLPPRRPSRSRTAVWSPLWCAGTGACRRPAPAATSPEAASAASNRRARPSRPATKLGISCVVDASLRASARFKGKAWLSGYALPMAVAVLPLPLLRAHLAHGFSDVSRQSVLEALRSGERRVVDLVNHTGLSQPNVSKHLRCLRGCGLVTVDKRGRESFYALPPAVTRLLDALDEASSQLAPQMAACQLNDETIGGCCP